MTEKQLQRAVLELAKRFGWRYAHAHPLQAPDGRWLTGMQGDKGWPDIVLFRRNRWIAAELKGTRGRFEEGQEAWLEAMSKAGAETYVWRPVDYLSGHIDAVLRGA